MVQEKNYLIETLKEAGLSAPVYTSMKRLRAANELQLGGVLRCGEKVARSGSKKHYTDEEGRRVTRRKLWDKDTVLSVVIADNSEERLEEILVRFLVLLKKGLEVDRNWVGIEVADIDWVEKDDSLLKPKVAVQFDVTFSGGIYQDTRLKQMGIGIADVRKETGKNQ